MYILFFLIINSLLFLFLFSTFVFDIQNINMFNILNKLLISKTKNPTTSTNLFTTAYFLNHQIKAWEIDIDICIILHFT